MGAHPLTVDTAAGTVTLSNDRPYVLGRGRDCDVVVEDTKISRRHLVLEPAPNGWTARDTSANGVWHDGRKVTTVDVGAGTVVLRLGSADGPQVLLAVPAPAGAGTPVPAKPGVADAATMLAPRGAPPPLSAAARASAAARGAADRDAAVRGPAGRDAAVRGPADRSFADAQTAPPDTAAGGPTGGSALGRARWLRAVPTLLWLAATGFTLGALIALS